MFETVLSRFAQVTPPGELALTATQKQVDALVESFAHEATDWKSLCAMVAGGFAYRFGRMSTLSLAGKSAAYETPMCFLSYAVGLGSEAGAFEAAHRACLSLSGEGASQPTLWSWEGKGGFKEGWKRSFLTFGILKGAGAAAANQNILLAHFVQDTAMVAGNQLAARWELAPAPDGGIAEQLLHAEITNLQMSAGMSFAHTLSGGRLTAAERSLDLFLQLNESGLKARPNGMNGPLWAYATAFYHRFRGVEKEPEFKKNEPLQMSRLGDTDNDDPPTLVQKRFEAEERAALFPSESEQTRITERYRRLFPATNHEFFSEEIIREVLKIPSPLPRFHENLLDAMLQPPNRGSKAQSNTALAIQDVFRFDALHSSTGSFKNAKLQFLITQAMTLRDAGLREKMLQEIFGAMEAGLTRSRLNDLFERYIDSNLYRLTAKNRYDSVFYQEHIEQAEREWKGYSTDQQTLLFNFIFETSRYDALRAAKMIEVFGDARSSGRYAPELIDSALAYAAHHPLGKMILHRILQVFSAEDSPVKLKELRSDDNDFDTITYVRDLKSEGLEPEQIARKINGTLYTAYLDDMRVARKVVSVSLDLHNDFKIVKSKDALRYRLYRACEEFLKEGRAFTVPEMMDLLQTNPSPQTRFLADMREAGEFELEILSETEFNRRVEGWRNSKSSPNSLFIAGIGGKKGKILIRELPSLDLSTESGRNRAYLEIVERLEQLVHEFEHWKQSQGLFEGSDHATAPIDFRPNKISREERIASEIMAYLEDYRWSARNVDSIRWELSRRLGEPLPLYFRNIADRAYYQQVNEHLLLQLGFPFFI